MGLTEKEQKLLIKYYPEKGKYWCVNKLNKSESCIRYHASKLKLRQNRNSEFFKEWQEKARNSKIGKKRPIQSKLMKERYDKGLIKIGKYTEQTGEQISLRMKEWYRINEHPKGFLGKNHSNETKILQSERSKKMWKNEDNYLNSEIHKQSLSDRMSKLQQSGQMRNRYSNGRMGTYDINGEKMFFRSLWEVNYALYLDFLIKNKEIKKWEYEKDTFWFEAIKRGVRSYKPDFKVFNNNDSIEYHEVKGWMDPKSKTKLKRMAKYHPEVKMVLIDSVYYKDLKKKVGKLIGFYE